MCDRQKDLCLYRYNDAIDTLEAARLCYDNKHYKDTINRCYYAAFYAVKAVLALESVDFRRHKDVIAYFNQHYVAADIFPRDMGRKLGKLKQKRETSDYDDFYIASLEEAQEQIAAVVEIIKNVKSFLADKEIFESR